MNDRILLAVRHLATDESDVRRRVAIAAATLSRIGSLELNGNELRLRDEIVQEAQRYPAIRDANGNVSVTAFDETARRSTRKSAQKIAFKIWDLYQATK